jgi:hypothetical protein
MYWMMLEKFEVKKWLSASIVFIFEAQIHQEDRKLLE